MKDYIVNPVAIRLDSSDRGSIYEAITAMGLRARQINDDVKQTAASSVCSTLTHLRTKPNTATTTKCKLARIRQNPETDLLLQCAKF